MSFYPIVRDAGRDTKYSNIAWVCIGAIPAAILVVVFHDFGTTRTVMLQPPADASISIDGEIVEPPYLLDLDVGTHVLEIEGPRGTARRTYTLEVTGESRAQVFIIDASGMRKL